ncbi:MAG: glycerol-3-phosphate 1-O-acyltransferase PlsY [Planctomycetales bacterium]|nr:glycerol-3-phosphate 1-O-acyltransferase PlsY [bacterium]UNM09598.1 MAG: glycerol-3-phosphate 1-O-acyltransferase PlsY [Planctomycetales bacterium]
MPLYYLTVLALAGFLSGSLPFGWLVARLGGMDIRKHGSGNIGMTNVWRVMGWKAGLTVLLLDVAKGLLPVLLAGRLMDTVNPPGLTISGRAWLLLITGLAAILGHTFTPWLKFRGGKGVATSLGVLIALYQLWVLAPLGVFLLALATTRMVSVGSILAALSVGILAVAVPALRPYMAFGIPVALLVVWTHRSNIRRILDGTESRVGSGKKKPAAESAQADQ